AVVLAYRDIGAALLGATDRDDDGGLAGMDLRAQLGPAEVLQLHGGGRLRNGRLRDGEQHGERAGAYQGPGWHGVPCGGRGRSILLSEGAGAAVAVFPAYRIADTGCRVGHA